MLPGNSKQSFHGFSRLPSELRYLIWQYTCPVARTIIVTAWRQLQFICYDSDPIVAKDVCKESRRVVLGLYQPLLDGEALSSNLTRYSTPEGCKILFSTSRDTLSFSCLLSGDDLARVKTRHEIKHVALSAYNLGLRDRNEYIHEFGLRNRYMDSVKSIYKDLTLFKALESLTVVVREVSLIDYESNEVVFETWEAKDVTSEWLFCMQRKVQEVQTGTFEEEASQWQLPKRIWFKRAKLKLLDGLCHISGAEDEFVNFGVY